jgi:V8-like Glu-specific endopeptidase
VESPFSAVRLRTDAARRFKHPGESFQTSMNTLGGASGGPVFNEHGEVFAVVSSGIDGRSLAFS